MAFFNISPPYCMAKLLSFCFDLQISCWDLHCRRLAHSLRRILSSLEGTCNATSALNDADTAQERQNLVCPLLRSSLAAAAAAGQKKCCINAWKVVVLLPIKPQPPQAQTGWPDALTSFTQQPIKFIYHAPLLPFAVPPRSLGWMGSTFTTWIT